MSDFVLTLAGDNPVPVQFPGALAASAAGASAAQAAGSVAEAAQIALNIAQGNLSCYIVAFYGQSLTIARAPQVTSAPNIPPNLFMPAGGSEWPTFTNPAPAAPTGLAAVPAHFANFVPFAPTVSADAAPALGEGLAPGFAHQFYNAGANVVITCAPGFGGQSLSQLLAGGGTTGNQVGPFMTNLHIYLRAAVKWARSKGLLPRIVPIFIQGHADADALYDGGGAGVETTQAQYVAGLTKMSRDIRTAASLALGEPFADPIWMQPLLTGGSGGAQYTLAGRRQVANAQLQACTGAIPGLYLVPPISQFAANIATDLVHPVGQGYRYNGELLGAAVLPYYQGAARPTPPYIIGKSVLNGTQVAITFDQPVQVSGLVAEATTSGVNAGLEAYTAGGVQLPITAVSVSGAVVTITMADTATFSVVRNGLAQVTTGTGSTLFPRTRIAGLTNIGTAEDGTVLGNFSVAQEF